MPDAVIVSAGPLACIDGVRGVVHAVFPSAVYVEVTDAPMLVVHGPGHGHTPTSLIVDAMPRAGWGRVAGDVVTGRLGHLRLGATLLDGRQARPWRTRLPSCNGVATATAAEALPAITSAATAGLAPACSLLTRALAAGDAEAVDASAAALIGSGPGLTPAGDDALVGLLALLHRAVPPAQGAGALRLLRASLDALLVRTTPISAHYLRLALDGHFGEPLTDLVDALGAPAWRGAEALSRVRATGASSGADALAGVVAGLHWCSEIEATLHEVEETA